MTRPHASSPRSAQPVSDAAVDALNKALAAEHAAVYAYGLAAARARGTVRERITGGFNAHRAQRDRLRALVVERGGTPAEAQPAYAVPFTPGSSAQALRLAAQVEDGVAAVYLELAAVADTDVRRYAAQVLQEVAVRAYTLRPEPTALPGYPRPESPPPSAKPSGSPSAAPSQAQDGG